MRLPADLKDLDRFVSINWRNFEACPADEFEAFAALTSKHHIPRLKQPSDFVIANGLLKLRDVISSRTVLNRPALSVDWRQFRRSRTQAAPEVSLTAEKEPVGEFSELVIVTSAVNPSVQALAFTLDDIVGVRPQIYLLRDGAPESRPPWHSSGAWYAKGPASASRALKLDAGDVREIKGWPELANIVAQRSSTLFLLCGMSILPKPLLEGSRATIMNIHNGVLPGMRGMDSPAWSFVYGLPPCITLHMVDHGVDTGKPLQVRETYRIAGEHAFSKGAFQRAKAQVLGDCLTKSPQGGIMLSMITQENLGDLPTGNRIHYSMHPTLRSLISLYCA